MNEGNGQMLGFNDITKALWAAMADNAQSTDRMARAGGFDALRFFMGELANTPGLDQQLVDAIRAEFARMEAF